ncbi:myosin-2-like [Asparagus officinalis]|uniref:myosin-2-like n=1 Tax=Asparagus officinalis TaxID=4686 RepID=UPI00098DF6D6|nr:myosin-2-like [Asparagus officinalis]
MLVAPPMGPSVVRTRSSLEVMLDSLMKKDEEKPEDLMPALPARPMSRGRRPSFKRSLLPVILDTECSNGFKKKKEEMDAYSEMPELESYEERRSEGVGAPQPSTSPSDGKKFNCALIKDLRVWCHHRDAKWELGKIQSVSGDVTHVKSSNGKVLAVPTENILPANPDVLDGVSDLIQLSYLNEPSVIQNLQYRYSRDMIYTKAGPILVALNPYKEVSLHGSDLIAAYRQKRLIDNPHVFAMADTAYSEMMRDGKKQSIIVSGESGSGKTETAKFAMQYLAAVGGGSGIEEEVLQTNLILESFGNAKTLRNDNSSRFGKLIEINFSKAGKICGAEIQTFLLEKSRVVQRAIGERSYHVFYQLCAGAPIHLKEKLNLKAANEYEYLKQSNCLTITDIDDAKRFHMLTEALDIVKICKEDQENAFAMLATVLWLGNIGFSVIDEENHVEVDMSEGVTNAAKLMGCKVSDLMMTLSTRTLQTGSENVIQKLTLSQAIDTRDALAKSLYASLFDWLVGQLNKSLEVGDYYAGKSISILDIYGFEYFHRNGFEQLCINYANERLQQHINQHFFKLGREEYSQNGMDWTNVDFVDNMECLELFEKKQIGLLSLLDEVSALPKATDMTFANKLKQNLSSNACFKAEKGGAFRICHFAGEVLYNTIGFLEKNKDSHHSDYIELLSSCSCQLPQLFASRMHNQVSPFLKLNGATQQQSVGTNFKDQLFKLMEQLERTSPHFIRCIKPNGQHLPGLYEHDLVLQQLRCCGILEVVRMSKLGYPSWMTHQQFTERYGFFLSRNVASQDPLSVSVNILEHFSVPPDTYQVGYTKIFFRSGQIASLEEVRHRTLQAILCVQKRFRALKVRRHFQELKNGVTMLQSFIRGGLAREHFNDLKSLKMSRTNYMRATSDPNFNMQELVETNKEQCQLAHAVDEDLQRRVLKAEAALKIKEEENLTLKQELQLYKTKWSDYEAKMKSMEELWQKQMTSLQMSLAAAKKSLAVDDSESQQGKLEPPPNNLYSDCENTSSEFQTPEVTPAKQPRGSAAVLPRNSNGNHNAVSHMVKEFEQQKKVFEDDAKFLIEVKAGQSVANMNPNDELQKLKVRFATWKKDYKVKLKETKMELQKLGNSEQVKTRKRWWNLRSTK